MALYVCNNDLCRKEFRRAPSQVRNPERVYCSMACANPYRGMHGERNPNFIDGRSSRRCVCGRRKNGRSARCAMCARRGRPAGEDRIIARDALVAAVAEAINVAEAARSLGVSRHTVSSAIVRYEVNVSHFTGRKRGPRGEWVTKGGYRMLRKIGDPLVLRPSGVIAEHRYVVASYLGRPLLDSEEVHHRNGVRLDNRLENLQLWSTAHPSGQTIGDLVRWAKEILGIYGELVETNERLV